jgi:hypothetical protein
MLFVLMTCEASVAQSLPAGQSGIEPNGGPPAVPLLPAPEREVPVREIKIFHLENAHAQTAAEMLKQLFDEVTIVVDDRLNAIIVRGAAPDSLQQIEAVLVQLDQPGDDRSAVPATGGPSRAYGFEPGEAEPPATATGTGTATTGTATAAPRDPKFAGPYVEQVAQLAREVERHALELARQHRQLAAEHGDAKQLDSLKARLQAEVGKAFEARQQAQRIELAALAQRLQQIERTIAARERIKDRIIERRLEELLDPALRWDVAAAGQPAAGNPAVMPTGVPPTAASSTPGGALPPLGGTPPQGERVPPGTNIERPDGYRGYPPGGGPFPSAAIAGDIAVLQARLDAAAARHEMFKAGYEAGEVGAAAMQEAAAEFKVAEAEVAAARRRHEQERELLKIDVEEAEVNFEAARLAYDRVARLQRSGATSISQSEVEALQTAAEQARIAVERAKLKLEFHMRLEGNPSAPPSGTSGTGSLGPSPGGSGSDAAPPGGAGSDSARPVGSPPGGPGSAAKADEPPAFDGVITAINHTERLIEISLGHDDGLKVGQPLGVFRDSTWLADIVVREVAQSSAVAMIVQGRPLEGNLRQGDHVSSRLAHPSGR